ncbi:TPA: hypothetical protein ACWWDT_001834 [Enterococcus faecium]
MRKKEIMNEIARLTQPGWDEEEEEEVVRTVQALSKKLNKRKDIEDPRARTIVVYHQGKVLISGDARTVAGFIKKSVVTVRTYARKNYVDMSGKQFSYLEES